MIENLTKDYLDGRLGTKVHVGDEKFIIAYEHNTGRLSLYSEDGRHYVRRLRKGDIVTFEDNSQRIVSRTIKE